MDLNVVTAVVINFQTPDLTERAVRSFRSVYPDVQLLLIDNGSGDGSVPVLRALKTLNDATTEIVENATNMHHGPAMDQAFRATKTPLVFFLDSDCEVRRGGFLETMIMLINADPKNYAVGKKIFMNNRGFDTKDEPGAHPYIRPICMLVRREAYIRLPPFERHGAPCLANFIAANNAGLELIPFRVEDFVDHKGRGTAGRFGYRLGLKGRINHLLNKFRL